MSTILLHGQGGLAAMVDDDLPVEISGLRWRPWVSGTGKIYVCAKRCIDGVRESVLLHRLVLDAPDGVDVDHINRNTLDNRRSNLRLASRSENNANRGLQKNNSSGFRGVRLSKGRYWIAQIKVDGRQIYLGSFPSAFDAALAYDRACLIRSGDFAVLNFPELQREAA